MHLYICITYRLQYCYSSVYCCINALWIMHVLYGCYYRTVKRLFYMNMWSLISISWMVGVEKAQRAPDKDDDKKKRLGRKLTLRQAFVLLAVVRLGFAWWMPVISDCDETFNFWEPLHYLHHGYGLQTWEYSPTYAIRSWSYILLHYLPIAAIQFNNKVERIKFGYWFHSLFGSKTFLFLSG